LHHAEAEGYELLGHLVALGVGVGDVWGSLYVPVLCRPSPPALRFLARHLAAMPLPPTKPRHKLRLQLLAWLLPSPDDFSGSGSGSGFTSSWDGDIGELDTDVAAIKAEILVALSIRDTTAISIPTHSPSIKTEPSKMEKIQAVYMCLERETPPEKPEGEETEKLIATERLEKNVWNKVVDALIRDTEQLMTLEEMDVSILQMKSNNLSPNKNISLMGDDYSD
jgi:hypothetical protein